MSMGETNHTASVLKDVAARVSELDSAELQREIQLIQLELQEVGRQLQERNLLQQLKQLDLQRRAERASGLTTRARPRPDRDVQAAVDQLHAVVNPLNDSAIQQETTRLQAELQDLNRQAQERQHLLALHQMLGQSSQQGQINLQFNVPLIGPQLGVPIGSTVQPAFALGVGQSGPRVDAETKRQAILELLRRQPTRHWTPSEVRDALARQGMQGLNKGTPVRNLLWKMHKDGLIDRPRDGAYSALGAGLADGEPGG